MRRVRERAAANAISPSTTTATRAGHDEVIESSVLALDDLWAGA